MKLKVFLILSLLSATSSAQILVFDDFSNASIDAGLWTTALPNGSSAVVESGGVLITTARGLLGTVNSFDASYKITGSFTMLDSLEHFNISLRTDLSESSFGERPGVLVSFSNDGDEVSIQRYVSSSESEVYAVTGYSLMENVSYNFSVIDTGSSVSLSINGASTLYADTSFSVGSKIGFYSREFGGTATAINSITVTAVPEPSTYPLILGLVALTGAVITRRRVR